MFDLTHPVETGMQTYPGDPEVVVEPHATHDADGYRVSRLACGSHAGTHVDAPAHTEPDGATLDEFDVEAFVREARVVDCRDLGARDPIPAGRVPAPGGEDGDDDGDAEVGNDGVDCVVFHTGWSDHWGSDRYLDHPYLAPAAAERCAERDLAVATDTLSPDPTPTGRASDEEPDGFAAHHAVLGAGLPVFENLTNLEAAPERFELRASPLALTGDGAPVRAVGVPES